MNGIKAGRIRGSALSGLCERACIEVKKIFDGCASAAANESFTVRLEGFTGGTSAPFTFTSAAESGFSTVGDVVVTGANGEKSRLGFTVTTPIIVTYVDSAGETGTASAAINFAQTAEFVLPDRTPYPYAIEAAVSLFSDSGAFLSADTVTFSACVMRIARVTATVEMLVPTYGYCEYPTCESAAGRCPGVAGRPRFPR